MHGLAGKISQKQKKNFYFNFAVPPAGKRVQGMELPGKFCEAMQAMLGSEWEDFLACYAAPVCRGVRLNPLKCSEAALRGSLPFPLRPSPFSPLSFYVEGEERFGPLPAHHAGMFYSQEPSASSAVTALDPQPGERILDLCAAPGGKSTQIAALLEGEGLLWSNEVVRGRAEVLLSNLERMGVCNSVVSNSAPQRLCGALQGWFDRVLVDAPCSGEGMFRRDRQAVEAWSPEHVESCAQRQRLILDSAAQAVKEGGVLVYSTCTFSLAENEGTCAAFLRAHPEFTPEPIPADFGRPALDGSPARRIFPMDGGEGHFVARFRREGANPTKTPPFAGESTGAERRSAEKWYKEIFCGDLSAPTAMFGGRVLALPQALPDLTGLHVLRAGVELAQVKGRRWEPAHGIFMSRKKADCRRAMDFPPDSQELQAFLRGEEISCPDRGYTAVCVNGVVTGFGKASDGRLKNRYPKGLRQRS